MAHNLVIAWFFFQFTEWAGSYVSTDVKTEMVLGIIIIFISVILYQVEKSRAGLHVGAAA